MSRPGHDARFKRLFSDPNIVAQLLREFVDGPWIGDLHPESMVPLPTEFQTVANERRDSDKIWRVPRRDGTNAYLVLMLEFQSTSDRNMALRVNTYTCLLWQQLIAGRQLMPGGELPPVLPVVLYNGKGRWDAPLADRESLGLPQGSTLWQWQPDMRYYLIDIGVFTKAELEAKSGLPAFWFRMERADNKREAVMAVIDALPLLYDYPEFRAARALFNEFLQVTVGNKDKTFEIPDNLLEAKTMLIERAEQWEQEWLLEGQKKGRKEGEAALLLRQLERRFGTLPDWAASQVAGADTDTLEEWGLRILDANRLEDVITERPA